MDRGAGGGQEAKGVRLATRQPGGHKDLKRHAMPCRSWARDAGVSPKCHMSLDGRMCAHGTTCAQL